jgi:hypothetical protein
MAGALEAQRKLNQIIGIAIGVNMSRWKDIMGFMGFDMGYTVYPTRLQTKEEKLKLKEDLDKINFFDLVK